MFLAERSIRLIVVILVALLIGWKVRQHRLGALSTPPAPAVPAANAFSSEPRPHFPDE